MSDVGKRFLLDLKKKPGNDKCADCGQKDPSWTSFNIGIFICQECAGMHRDLGVHISKVRSVQLDNWDKDQLEMMESQGNLRVKERVEQFVPPCYRRPNLRDPRVLREEWIRAKYQREEFQDPERQDYLRGQKQGYLYKLGKDTTTKFKKRKFVLSETDGTLKYYVNDYGSPKAVLRLDYTTVAMVPEKVNHPHGMQIMFQDPDNHTRNIYVYAEKSKDCVDWYTCIRSAKLNRFRIAYPGANDGDLVNLLPQDFVMEGWLVKKGPRPNDTFRRRWCSLSQKKLMYFVDPLGAYPKAEVFLGTEQNGYSVVQGIPPGIKEPGSCFTLKTPDRHFYFAAETHEERQHWIEVLESVLKAPMSLQDNSNLAIGQKKRSSFLGRLH